MGKKARKMSNEITSTKSIKTLLNAEITKEKFYQVLGKKAPAFVASVLAAVNNDKKLQDAEPNTILSAAMTAATLDLPINPNLGFAYIIPYDQKVKGEKGKADVWIKVAQFQMGYKGFIQLAMRSGQFRTINVTDVREGEITSTNRLTGQIEFAWKDGDLVARDKLPVIGYVAYIELLNGFEKSKFMSVDQLKNHGLKYSKNYKKYNSGLWVDDFDSMASKTVLKLLISKYAPLTTEMQTAQLADQAVIKGDNYEYIDNKEETPTEVGAEKERTRIINHIKNSKTAAELQKCEEFIRDAETRDLYDERMDELEKEANK